MNKEPDWEAINRDWQASGMSQPEFCKKAGVSYSQFCAWRSRQIKRGRFESLRYKVRAGMAHTNIVNMESDFVPIELKRPERKVQIQKEKFIELLLPHGMVLRMPVDVS